MPPSPVEPAPPKQPKTRRDVARPTAASAARATPSPSLERRSGSPPTVPKVRRTATPSPPLAAFSRKHSTPISGARHRPRPRKQKAESPLAKFRARAHESFLGAGAKPPRAPPPPPSGQPLVTRARSEPALVAAPKKKSTAMSVGTFDATGRVGPVVRPAAASGATAPDAAAATRPGGPRRERAHAAAEAPRRRRPRA